MVLEFLKEQMDDLNVPYRFWEWAGEIPQTYFVGEYTETGAIPKTVKSKAKSRCQDSHAARSPIWMNCVIKSISVSGTAKGSIGTARAL